MVKSSAIEPVKKVKASLKCSQLLVGRKGTRKFNQISKNTSSLFNLGLRMDENRGGKKD